MNFYFEAITKVNLIDCEQRFWKRGAGRGLGCGGVIREKGRLDGFVENLVAFSQFLRLNWICELNQQIRRKKTFDCE